MKNKLFSIKTCLAACLVSLLFTTTLHAQEATLSDEQTRKYEYFFLEATKLKAMNNLSGAFELYRHALDINPDGPAALYEIAQLYLFLNQVPTAQQAMEKAVANDPSNYWYAQGLAGLYQQRGMNEKAIEVLEDMTKRFPDKDDVLFGLLEMYSEQQDYNSMIATLDRLEDKIGKSEQISMEKFRIYLAMQDHEKAFDEIESLVREYPLDTRYQVILGDVYMQNGRENEAYEVLRKALDAEPGNPMATLSLASYYEKTGQTALYEQQLDSLLLNKQVTPDVKLNILRQLVFKSEQAKKDSTEIISIFERVIAQDTEDTQIPMLYAQYLLTKQMEDESIPVLEHILRLDPANTAARITLLGSAIRKNDFDWVIRITEPGVEVSPDVIEFYYYLGISYYQKEQYDKALDIFQKALQNLPEGVNKEVVSDFYSMIGDIQHTKNKMTEAFAAYDSALVYNSQNVGALNNYAYYLSIKKKPTEAELDKAEEMSHKTVKKEPTNSTYLDTYAWILFIKGNYAEAKLYIDDALRNEEEPSDVIVEHAGDIYYMTGDREGAVELWKKAKELGSESKTLKKKISRKKYIPE